MLQLLIDPIQSWLFSFDIKSGYHHIDIFENDQEFLRFSWPYQGKVRYFKFTVLPFGLATGPYIFTKVMRPLVKHWRGQAYRIVVYLDDGLGACPSFDSALQQSSSVRADLVNCGFVPSEPKCIWFPKQNIQWLGLDWDLQQQLLCIPKIKIDRLFVAVDEALAKEKISARQLASVTGLIMSNVVVFGNICKFMTKALHRVN